MNVAFIAQLRTDAIEHAALPFHQSSELVQLCLDVTKPQHIGNAAQGEIVQLQKQLAMVLGEVDGLTKD